MTISSFSLRLASLTTLSLAGVLLTGCGKKEANQTAASTPAPAQSAAADQAQLDSVEQRVSYGIGYSMGMNIARRQEFKPDVAALHAGIADALAGGKLRLSEDDINAAFMEMDRRVQAAAAEAASTNLAAAQKYLADNKNKSGVTTTASGLQYEVIKSGSGPKPTESSRVKVHYHGTLINGTVFDSSVDRGEPTEFGVTQVIPGWTEALQLMSVGDKWKLTIPPGLAYGERNAGAIPPNSALIFEVELLEIK